MAFKFRKIIESIVGVSGSISPVGAAMGLLAVRSAARMPNRGPARYQHNAAPKTIAKPSTRVATRGGIGGAGGAGSTGGGGGGGGGGPFPPGGPDGGISVTRVPFHSAAPPPLSSAPAEDAPRSLPGPAPQEAPSPPPWSGNRLSLPSPARSGLSSGGRRNAYWAACPFR